MATPERPLPPAIAEELAARAGGHPLLLRSWPAPSPAVRTRTSSRRPSRSSPRARSTGCHRRSVRCCGGPRYWATSSTRTCCSRWSRTCARAVGARAACRTGGLDRGGGSPAAFSSSRFFGRSRTRACPTNDAANCMPQAAEVLEANTSAADRCAGDPRPSLLRGRSLRQGDGLRLAGGRAGDGPLCAGRGRRRLSEGGPGCPTLLKVSPSERSFYLEALGDAQFLAGRSTEAAAAYLEALRGCGASRCGRLIWRSSCPGGATPRPLHQRTAPGEPRPACS